MLLCVLGGSDVALGPRDDLALFVGDGGAEFGEAEQFEDAAAGVVEDFAGRRSRAGRARRR